jgi:LacI family transcriptional regulator
MNVTIKDVALAAGVSIATVSRVLNDKGPIREETRERVKRAAARLAYVPHGGARSLITRRTGTVGVLLPDIHGDFFSELIRGVDTALRPHGYHLLVASSYGVGREGEAALRALRGRVDGLIIMSPDLEPLTLRAHVPEPLPVVMLNCLVKDALVDSISIDNFGGALAMTRHLLGIGHSRIAFIEGPPGNHDAGERLRGYREALRAAGLDPGPELVLEGDFSEEAGYRAGTLALALEPRLDAIFAANDGMAVGVLLALHEAGVRAGEEIGLAGFDDIPIARFLSPALTSVQVPIAALGARATERLLVAINEGGDHERRHEVLATSLVVRQSCGAAAGQSWASKRSRAGEAR